MKHDVKILADSVSLDGFRVTTFLATFPRIILAEVNTHRMFSRNSASSRAIPVERMLDLVRHQPYIPTHWGKNQKGMQAEQEVSAWDQQRATEKWLAARSAAMASAMDLLDTGIHKQLTNRLLEPFMWHTAIITATEFENHDHLRANKDAHPEYQKLAYAMADLRKENTPTSLNYGRWHLPLVDAEEVESGATPGLRSRRSDGGVTIDEVRHYWAMVSAGRCAAVSYARHERKNPEEDFVRAEKLVAAGHMSPLEHPCRPMTRDELGLFEQRHFVWDEACGWRWDGTYTYFLGNVQGFVQLRKQIPGEEDIFGYRDRRG